MNDDKIIELAVAHKNLLDKIKQLQEKNKLLRDRLEYYIGENFECNTCGVVASAIEHNEELCKMCEETLQTLAKIKGDE